MGLFSIDIEIAKPGRGAHWKSMGPVIVDSGSELTWLPEEELRAVRIDMFRKDQAFIMANGQQISRDVGIALIRAGEFKTVDEVVFAKKGDLCLLGARTVEGFNALVDGRKKKLVAGGPIPAACARTLGPCRRRCAGGHQAGRIYRRTGGQRVWFQLRPGLHSLH